MNPTGTIRNWLGRIDASMERVAKLEATVAKLEATISKLEPAIAKLARNDRRVFYLGDHTALTHLHSGQRIYVDTRDVGICSHLMWEGRWEPWIETEIMKHVRKGMNVCDVGANFGFYTLRFASAVGVGGKVFSFEANPAIFKHLQKSVMVNGYSGFTTVHNCAVSDAKGEARFVFDVEFSGGGAMTAGAAAANQSEIVVKCETLDALVPADVPINVIKIDVEGAEPKVLAGAERVLSQDSLKVVLLEFFPAAIAQARDPAEMVDAFIARGFSIHLLEPRETIPIGSGAQAVEKVGSGISYLIAARD